MHFKLTYSLSDMFLKFPESAAVHLTDEPGVILSFWTRETEDGGKSRKTLCCDAVLETAVPQKTRLMFESLDRGILPVDPRHKPDLPYQTLSGVVVDSEGRIAPNWLVPMAYFPPSFRECCRTTNQRLAAIIRRFVGTMRWVQGASGRHRPYASVGFYWSLDGDRWQSAPHGGTVTISTPRGLDARASSMAQVSNLLASGHDEPFAHELVREAIEAASLSPRSALLIGVAALEYGLKSYLAFLVPKSEAILERMPSPPVVDIIQEIIPRIWKDNSYESTTFPVDDSDRKYLVKWVLKRNKLVHGSLREINSIDVRTFLGFVQGILYKLDVERGHAWAGGVSVEVPKVLGQS